MYDTLKVLGHFPISESVTQVSPIGNGHINDTFGVYVTSIPDAPKYILQRINHHIFTDIDTLQENIFRVTAHIRQKLLGAGVQDIDRRVLTFITTRDGKKYHYDGENYWRVCYYIPDSICIDTTLTPKLAYEAGQVFGEFQYMLSDLPAEDLGETIMNFHNMEHRLAQLREACAQDPKGRAAKVADLLKEIEQRAHEMCVQERMYRDGLLAKRINHCDTKVNNILFDRETQKVLAVIDLDTVMPGFVLSDIGDFIRTAVNTGKEDDECLSSIGVDMEVFRAYLDGYMTWGKTFLTPTEIQMLPYGGRLLTYMQVVRFLTDYINGDVYFKTHKPEHNLIRTRAQFEYLKRLEEARSAMDAIISEWL